MEGFAVCTDSFKDSPFQVGLVPFDTLPKIVDAAPARSISINFFELVEDIDKGIYGTLGASGENTANIFQAASPGQDSCSALSTNMDFETLTGTAESTMQLPGGGAPLSWTASEQSTVTGAALNSAAVSAAFRTSESAETPFDSLFMHDDEVMSMTLAPAEKPKLEQVQALAEFLQRQDSFDNTGDSPGLAAFGSRDSVYSAPALEERHSCVEPTLQAPSGLTANAALLKRSASASARLPVSMSMLSRSLSVAAAPLIKKSYSTAGPGTNRPPKDGSVSALLPKDKLNRKRAAARRYYHNQKNKAVDYEVAIARLETENEALSKELVQALKQLELLKQAQVAPMRVC